MKLWNSIKRFDRNRPKLTANEKKLDNYMANLRSALIGDMYEYDAYPPAVMFNKSYNDIIGNKSFQEIFKLMPCGGNLHIHTGAMYNTKLFANMLANNDNVYIYWDPIGNGRKFIHGKFLYLTKQPDDAEHFIRYAGLRRMQIDGHSRRFDESLQLLSFINNRIDGIPYIWDEFNRYFERVGDVLSVESIYLEYYKAAIRYQFDNNNDYIEIRAGVGGIVKDNDYLVFPQPAQILGPVPPPYTDDPPKALKLLMDAYQDAKNDGRGSLKVKVIVTTGRKLDSNPDYHYAKVADIIYHLPAWRDKLRDTDDTDFILGFDLVSEEDRNHMTDDYADVIIGVCRDLDAEGESVDFYFHDGESNWADNINVQSALILGTKRIGHGINIYNFPGVMDMVENYDICLEICPISNQLLRYTKDLRVHPIAQFLQRGVNCVVCSDDPQLFETAGTMFDLWEAYHGAMLSLLDTKELIRNSYTHSGMSDAEKQDALLVWEQKWETFVDDRVAKLNLN
jgi:adenosine deaminase CECR1